MGTSAIIKVEGLGLGDIGVYKHWDGFPDATMPWLEAFNKKFTEMRGDDPQYKIAQLLRSSARDSEEFDLDASYSTGWGIVDTNQCAADYTYTLMRNGTVQVTEG